MRMQLHAQTRWRMHLYKGVCRIPPSGPTAIRRKLTPPAGAGLSSLPQIVQFPPFGGVTRRRTRFSRALRKERRPELA
jgi:hypothetical protein